MFGIQELALSNKYKYIHSLERLILILHKFRRRYILLKLTSIYLNLRTIIAYIFHRRESAILIPFRTQDLTTQKSLPEEVYPFQKSPNRVDRYLSRYVCT